MALVPEHQNSSDSDFSSFDTITRYLDRFVCAWESESTPDPSNFLPPSGALRKVVLVEIIKYDLERRWAGDAEPLFLEDYMDQFPELAPTGIPLDLIYEEFHVKKNAGIEVDVEEYVDRFPEQQEAVRRILQPDAQTHSIALTNPTCRATLNQLKAGDECEDFDLIRTLGEGSFGKVFLARQRSMERLVALKISADRGMEAQTLARFDHDYIVRVYDQRTWNDGSRLLYMEYIAGGTLSDVVDAVSATAYSARHGSLLFNTLDQQLEKKGENRAGRSPWRTQLEKADWSDTVCWIGSCLAEALDHSHAQNVLHRDIKPANVLLTAEGIPKLADFNISYCSKLDGLSAETFFGGSLAYMSPEQLEACSPTHQREPHEIGTGADIYSLGVVLYQLLVGKRPFEDALCVSNWKDSFTQMIQTRKTSEYTYPDDLQCPEILKSTIDKCLHPEAGDRWQSAAHLQQRLTLLSHSRIRAYLFPPASEIRQRVVPFSRIIMSTGMLVPNVFAALFNFFYNEAKIIKPIAEMMGESGTAINEHFMYVQAMINLIAFPMGILGNDYFIRRSIREANAMQDDSRSVDWPNIVNVGFRCAILTLVVWLIAGLAYPISMSTQAAEASLHFYVHFFFSLLLCGLFAIALTYFNLTYYALNILVPRTIQQGGSKKGMRPAIAQCDRRNWPFLLTSAVVPMLASVTLAISTDQTPWILGAISLAGILAFMVCLGCMNRIQAALQILDSALDNDGD